MAPTGRNKLTMIHTLSEVLAFVLRVSFLSLSLFLSPSVDVLLARLVWETASIRAKNRTMSKLEEHVSGKVDKDGLAVPAIVFASLFGFAPTCSTATSL